MDGFRVAKFGGTSMGSPQAMRKAASIIARNPGTRVVIVSATSGTTNLLLEIYAAAVGGRSEAAADGLHRLASRHVTHAGGEFGESGTTSKLEKVLADLAAYVSEISAADEAKLDHVLSFGERLSAILFTRALELEGISARTADARDYLRTDSYFGKAEVDLPETRRLCAGLLAAIRDGSDTFVLEGFIGSDAQGRTTTLGRGGSDYSAALFAEALSANELEIWTDVAGILTMDPRVVATARAIPDVSFAEAAELANFGAKILHPATLQPALRAKIPIFVGSTFDPEKPGTWIRPEPSVSGPMIRAVAVRARQTLITVSSFSMLNAHGYLAKLFEVLARHRISVDLVTTSEVSIALTIDGTSQGSAGETIHTRADFFAELRSFAEVTVEDDLSLIAVIGNSLNHQAGIAAKVFGAIREFNVRLICHGASEHNICFLVSSGHASEVARRLHEVCIERGERESL